MPTHPDIARVVFDESHSEAWTIRADVAREMQPSHPEDSSYARAAGALRERSFAVEAHTGGPLDTAALADAAVLVLAHPSEPKRERTVPGSGPPRLSPTELDAIDAWVSAGGGLVLLAEEEQEKYGNNLAELAARFVIEIGNQVVSDYEHHHAGAPSWVLADLGDGRRGVDLLARVNAACFYRATTLTATNGARALARASATASVPGAALLAVAEHGAGRVAVLADSPLGGDLCIGELDHEALWLALGQWVGEPAHAVPTDPPVAPAAEAPDGAGLELAAHALRLLQEAD